MAEIQTLIERHSSALGSAAGLAKLRSVHMRGRMTEPQFTIDDFNVWRLKPAYQKVWFAFGDGEFAEGTDGQVAWEKPVSARHARQVRGAAADALRRGMQLPGPMNPLAEFVSQGHQLTWVRDEIIAGRGYHVLAATLRDGFEKVYYMDRQSGLLVRSRSIQALHPGLDPEARPIETVRSDFRLVSGVRFAFREVQRDWITGKQLSELVWHSIVANPRLEARDFSMPEDSE